MHLIDYKLKDPGFYSLLQLILLFQGHCNLLFHYVEILDDAMSVNSIHQMQF